MSDDIVKVYKERERLRQKNKELTKQNKEMMSYLNSRDQIVQDIGDLVQNAEIPKKVKLPKVKKIKDKKNMTLELMLSDLHFGKKTDSFNLNVARTRMKELCNVTLAEIMRSSAYYNVERIIIALLGDIIESYTMHGLESARGCEFGNSKQVQSSIESIFYDIILPIAHTGIRVDIPAVTGNHDRSEEDRTFSNPGAENLTWIIYNSLSLLAAAHGLTNVVFYIPEGPYQILEIYGNHALYEHGDNAKSNTRVSLEKLISDRQAQSKKVIDFFRFGHFHEDTMYGRGRAIGNGSLPGQDSYANIKGYVSNPGQTLNYYVETKKRPTCFYRSFPIYLK